MSYVKITFKNCGYDYDFTYCPWHDIKNQIEIAEHDFETGDVKSYKKYGKPEIIIKPMPNMDDESYEKWFKDVVEANA